MVQRSIHIRHAFVNVGLVTEGTDKMYINGAGFVYKLAIKKIVGWY